MTRFEGEEPGTDGFIKYSIEKDSSKTGNHQFALIERDSQKLQYQQTSDGCHVKKEIHFNRFMTLIALSPLGNLFHIDPANPTGRAYSLQCSGFQFPLQSPLDRPCDTSLPCDSSLQDLVYKVLP